MRDHLNAPSAAPRTPLSATASPVLAAFCHPINADASGFALNIEPLPRPGVMRQLRSAELQLLIYREILSAEAMHARRAHRVSSTFDARLRDVTHAILSKGPRQ